MLYRPASDDSRQFADYCVEALGVPRANLVPLPNAAADETLTDHSAYTSQIEAGIADYFALNPSVAGNCMCFLVGHDVPGYFTKDGIRQSVPSWLTAYGGSAASQEANPLYKPSTVCRLTKTSLAGNYLAARIDAPTLAEAKAILDRGIAVSQLAAPADDEKLYSDEADYRSSLACQRLRIPTAALGQFTRDAFVWGDTGTPAFGASGRRAAFVDTACDAAASLRSAAGPCRAALAGGYAAAMGASQAAEAFDVAGFFEMLRIGGTFAEAVAVSCAHIKHTACPAGSPLLTVGFAKSGYNVYHGLGGPDDIDWSQPVAYTRPGAQDAVVPIFLLPSQKHVFAARAVSSDGIEEHSAHVVAYAEANAAGQLLPAPLAAPTETTAAVVDDGLVLVSFSYVRCPGFDMPEQFDVFTDSGSGSLDMETPAGTVTAAGSDRRDFEIALPVSSLPTRFVVRPRKAEWTGPLGQVVTAGARPPATPQVL